MLFRSGDALVSGIGADGAADRAAELEGAGRKRKRRRETVHEHRQYRHLRAGADKMPGNREGVIDGPRVYFEDPDGNTLEIIDLTAYATILDEKHAH